MRIPIPGRRTLIWLSICTALLGQWLLGSYVKAAILLLGICLAASLADGWFYPVPLRANWLYPGLLMMLGLSMWQEPRGWFFIAWALIELGTGLRASAIERRIRQLIAAEEERQARMAALGIGAEYAPEPVAPSLPKPVSIPWWRYGLAIFVGFVVGRAMVKGAGGNTSRLLRGISAGVSALATLGGRYLILRYVLFSRLPGIHPEAEKVRVITALASKEPGKYLGVFLVAFVAIAAWCGWHYARPASTDQAAPR